VTTAHLALLSFRDVVVTPYMDLLEAHAGGRAHRGGPRWPDWDTQTAARHCRGGVPIDDEPPEAEPTSTIGEPVAWGGALAYHKAGAHYGHQIADFSTRLLPTLHEDPSVRFAFGVKERFSEELDSIEKLPDFFLEILDWYGIERARVDIVTEPTLVERLVVAPQAEQIGGPGPESWYLDLLDALAASRLGEIERSGSLYVSRSTQRSGFAGEAYLESVLEKAGFKVLYPETVTLEEKLRAHAGAESLVLAESSGLHTSQLMGRALGDVTVLVRNAGWKVAQEELTPRARSLRYVDAVRGALHGKDLEGRGGQAFWRALYVLDPERLEAGLPLGSSWDRKAFDEAIEADVAEWLEAERSSARWELPGSAEQVGEQLRALGFSHL
jgi:glycosyl transferase family 61